jgi:non-specific serine/threonine protein kinase/serine/threonine-protein kinase
LAQDIQHAFEKMSVSGPGSGLRSDLGERPGNADSIEGYEILSEIHRGGQGVVYKAVQLATKRTVALKVLLHGPYASPRQQHRFEREIDLVANLQHPNIVTVYDSGLTHGRHYFAMEYIHGQSLDTYLSNTKLSIDEVLRLFQKICSAVNAAHQRGVIHRDLKPGNIRVDSVGEPHILDFGLAKAAGSDLQGGAPVTVSGEFMGTLAYASPEQTRGDPNRVDIRTDVYSLGVILFEMLTGKYPYQVVGHMTEVLRNIAEVEPERPSTIRRQINNEVETIVLQALAKDKDRRYQTAEALARDVGRYLAGEAIEAKRDSTWYVLRKSLRRYRVAAGVAVAFVFLLAASTVALSIMYRNQSRAREEAETARRAEEEQRTLAEERLRESTAAKEMALLREAEAVAARAETQKRADELEIVTEFQQSMLSEIDAEEMGRALYLDLRSHVRESLEAEGISSEESESLTADFDRMLRRTNATDVALKLVDEQVLARAVMAIESDFADQPVVRAALQQAIASTYRQIGRYASAMPLQKAALQTRRVELGDDHPDTLASIDDMSHLLMEMGEFEDAQAYCREALEGRRRILGDDHPDTLESINNIGFLLQAQGKLAEAESFCREAVEKERVVLGDDHPDTLISINNLGFLLQTQGRLEEAEAYYREALEARRRVLGDEHPDTLDSINNMGILLRAQGKLVEAEAHFREVLKGFRRVLGDDHPRTLISLNNLGALLLAQGKLGEAESCWREAIAGRRRVLGDEHPDTLTSLNNLGFLLQKQGKLAEAESCWREALEGRRRVLGNEHPNTLTSINNLGFLLQKQGKPADAEKYYREALGKKRRVLGDDHPSTLRSVANLGLVLEDQHKLDEAEAFFREAMEAYRRVLGDDHPDTLGSVSNLARLLIKQGNHTETAALLVPAEAVFRRTYTDSDESALARFLVALGRARVGLGFEPGRFALAEANLMEAHSIFVETRGAAHEDTQGCVQGLVDLYDAWHAADPDGGYDARAAAWRDVLAESTESPAPLQP